MSSKGARPDNPIDIVSSRDISQPITSRVKCCHFITLKEIKRIYSGSTMAMGPDGIYVSQQ